jgi:hypothetical protein
MVHRHDGKKFKSKIRPWYAYQEPRVGRDVKRDKNPDKIPWDGPDFDGADDEDLLVSNDTALTDDFINDDFYIDSDSLSDNDVAPDESFLGDDEFFDEEEEEDEKPKKRKKRKGKKGEEEPEKKKDEGDPWDIENLTDEDTEEGDF